MPAHPACTHLISVGVGLLISTALVIALSAHADEVTRQQAADEAYTHRMRLSSGAINSFHQTPSDVVSKASNQFVVGDFCTSTGNKKGTAVLPDPRDFQHGTRWAMLKFSLTEPHFNKYCYRGTPHPFKVTATASVDAINDVVQVVEGRVDHAGMATAHPVRVQAGPAPRAITSKAPRGALTPELLAAITEYREYIAALDGDACETIIAQLNALDAEALKKAESAMPKSGKDALPPAIQQLGDDMVHAMDGAMEVCRGNAEFDAAVQRIANAIQ